MKRIIFTLFLLSYGQEIIPQFNVIQSIDFDTQQRVVYGLTGEYDYSYALRYEDGNLETWNLTQIFNLPFYWISTTIDESDNIWAFMGNKIYKFNGINWSQIDAPPQVWSAKYSDLNIDNNNLWITIEHYEGAYRLNLTDTTWTIFDSLTPEYGFPGIITIKRDSVWIPTSQGLVLIFNDSVSVVLDTLTSGIPTQELCCFFIDSNENRWLGSSNKGLIKWIDDTTFVSYNTSNSSLPHNFVNAIDEDSQGNLWLATDGGFACLKSDTIISYSYLINKSIISLSVDNLDRIWFGDLGTGNLLMFDGSNIITLTSVSDESYLHFDFQMSQNYPNPFNPLTTVKYQIPEISFVTIKVYDVLGRKVSTLINEEKSIGSYEVEFDATGLSSAIYFYRIQADDFTQVKKMILLK